ncbi:MAG: P-loop NTPase [Candidatus Micrarchaeota archaeon]
MIIGVTGGKGGTGKTFFAVNLAVALSKLGKKVTYLDCDADCPSAHFLFGAELEDKKQVTSFVPEFDDSKCTKCGKCASACQYNALYQLKDSVPTLVPNVCNGCKACQVVCPSDAIYEHKKTVGWTYETKCGGIELFSGELKPSDPLSERMVDAIKKRGMANSDAGYIIVDTAAGAHCPVVAALRGCDEAFAVTEPTLFGEHDFRIISSLLNSLKIPFKTVMNRSTLTKKKIEADVSIPYDEKVFESYVRGIPLVGMHPEHEISKEFLELAKRLGK